MAFVVPLKSRTDDKVAIMMTVNLDQKAPPHLQPSPLISNQSIPLATCAPFIPSLVISQGQQAGSSRMFSRTHKTERTKVWWWLRRNVQMTRVSERVVCDYASVFSCAAVRFSFFWGCQLPAVEAPQLPSSSRARMGRDGWGVWGTVKNNTGHISSTRVCKSLSQLIHQVCVFLGPVLMKRSSPWDVSRAGQNEKHSSSPALSLWLLWNKCPLKYFPAAGPPHISEAGLLVKCLSKVLCEKLGLSPWV